MSSVITTKKRGRKSKKDIESATALTNSDNMNMIIEENEILHTNEATFFDVVTSEPTDNVVTILQEKAVTKKRGRKPKGGKIIQQVIQTTNNTDIKPNIILHLKCSLKDLQMNTTNPEIQFYNFENKNNLNNLSYDIIEPNKPKQNANYKEVVTIIKNKEIYDDEYEKDDLKETWKKLKQLEQKLHTNTCDKKSACFWCTYDFDNPPVYIPKHFIKNSYQVYGCFCSPECATAYLMNENIDSSCKFERYYLLNNIYSKIYGYEKNIKPSPNPYYLLDKYCGNLTIQEYRALLKNGRLFLIVDKPLTRILPELHEDNDDFIINNKIIPSNAYQVKKKLQNKSKNILTEKFGLVN